MKRALPGRNCWSDLKSSNRRTASPGSWNIAIKTAYLNLTASDQYYLMKRALPARKKLLPRLKIYHSENSKPRNITIGDIREPEECTRLMEEINSTRAFGSDYGDTNQFASCKLGLSEQRRTPETQPQILTETKVKRNLGVFVDSQLSFKDHISQVISKSNKLLENHQGPVA